MGPLITCTVVQAAAPTSRKSCPKRVSFVVIAVNTETGYVCAHTIDEITAARTAFSSSGDPPRWKGLQLIRVET